MEIKNIRENKYSIQTFDESIFYFFLLFPAANN